MDNMKPNPTRLTDLQNVLLKSLSYDKSQAILSAAFDAVAPTEGVGVPWKNPINKTFTWKEWMLLQSTTSLEVVYLAVIHFTGSVPSFVYDAKKDTVTVTADGYYKAIGA